MGRRAVASGHGTMTLPPRKQDAEDDGGHDGEYEHEAVARSGGMDAAPKQGRTPETESANTGQDQDGGADSFEKLDGVHATECKRERKQRQGPRSTIAPEGKSPS